MNETSHGYKIVTPGEVEAVRTGSSSTTLLLDVRSTGEYRSHRIPGVQLLPVDELPTRFQELDPEIPTICICEHGIRSEAAAAFLASRDFDNVATMRGGMARWRGDVERG